LSPQILDGWLTLSSIYGFKGDHFILFRYGSQSCFKITVFMGEICEIGVNRYLKEVQGSEPLTKGPFEHFDITLSSFHIKRNYLVTLRILFLLNALVYILLFFFNTYSYFVEGSPRCICGISFENDIQKCYATWTAT